MKDLYEVMHCGSITHNYEWEEHFTDRPTKFYRVCIFLYEGQYTLVEMLDGVIVDVAELGKEEVE